MLIAISPLDRYIVAGNDMIYALTRAPLCYSDLSSRNESR